MRINSSGNVGIGTTSPSDKLEIKGTNGGYSFRVDAESTPVTIRSEDNTGAAFGAIRFTAGNASTEVERMRIGSGGNCSIGTTINTNKLRVHNGSDSANIILATGADESSEFISLGIDNSVPTLTAGGVSSTSASLAFRTASNGTEVERMRILDNGVIAFNATGLTADAPNNQGSRFFQTNGNTKCRGGSTSGTAVDSLFQFYHGTTTAAQVGSITCSPTEVAFNTNSDYRLKENVVNMTDGIARVKQLQPKRFNFIVQADKEVDGFLAHEAQAVVPEAVTGSYNEVQVWDASENLPNGVNAGDTKLDDDGNTIPKYQGIDQSKFVPLLTAALQEAIAKIETLETKVAALEAG